MFNSYNAQKSLYDEQVRALLADAKRRQQAQQSRRWLLRPLTFLTVLIAFLLSRPAA